MAAKAAIALIAEAAVTKVHLQAVKILAVANHHHPVASQAKVLEETAINISVY